MEFPSNCLENIICNFRITIRSIGTQFRRMLSNEFKPPCNFQVTFELHVLPSHLRMASELLSNENKTLTRSHSIPNMENYYMTNTVI